MKVTRVVLRTIACCTMAMFSLAIAYASDGSPRSRDTIGADFGSGWNILSIPAAAFGKRLDGTIVDSVADGYVYVPSGAATLWAPIFLPSGAGIGYVGVYAFDSDALFNVRAMIWRFTGYGSKACLLLPCAQVPPDTEEILDVSTTGTPGYRYEESAELLPVHTVNNDTAYGNGGQYVVVVSMSASPAMHLRFKGVDVWWKRQISTAPAAATFSDVPVGSQFFAEIEAMRSAGITAGCTASTYCPEATVTRRQMAAFFARALGLYWGY